MSIPSLFDFNAYYVSVLRHELSVDKPSACFRFGLSDDVAELMMNISSSQFLQMTRLPQAVVYCALIDRSFLDASAMKLRQSHAAKNYSYGEV